MSENTRYWAKFIIYIILSMLTPWATLFTSMSPDKINAMLWPEWVGTIITSVIAGLIAARAFFDTSSGVIKADKEWEEYLNDVNTQVKEQLNHGNPIPTNTVIPQNNTVKAMIKKS